MILQRWFYRGGRPNRVARVLNRGGALVYARGVAPDYLVTLEVAGRRSGKTISFPLVMAVVGGERYLVSMLGEGANWVRNVRAAGGNATLRHGRREEVRLEEVAPELRARAQGLPEAGARGQAAPAGRQGRSSSRLRADSAPVPCVPGRAEGQGMSGPIELSGPILSRVPWRTANGLDIRGGM
jgi:hypothetical protein